MSLSSAFQHLRVRRCSFFCVGDYIVGGGFIVGGGYIVDDGYIVGDVDVDICGVVRLLWCSMVWCGPCC